MAEFWSGYLLPGGIILAQILAIVVPLLVAPSCSIALARRVDVVRRGDAIFAAAMGGPRVLEACRQFFFSLGFYDRVRHQRSTPSAPHIGGRLPPAFFLPRLLS